AARGTRAVEWVIALVGATPSAAAGTGGAGRAGLAGGGREASGGELAQRRGRNGRGGGAGGAGTSGAPVAAIGSLLALSEPARATAHPGGLSVPPVPAEIGVIRATTPDSPGAATAGLARVWPAAAANNSHATRATLVPLYP